MTAAREPPTARLKAVFPAYDPVLHGPHRDLGSVFQLQLGENAHDVAIGRATTDDHLLGNLTVRIAARQENDDFPLATGKRTRRRRRLVIEPA